MGVWRSRRRAGASSSIQLAGVFSLLALIAGCGGRSAHSGGSSSEAGGADTGIAGAATVGGASATAGAPAAAGSTDGGAASEACAPGHAPLRLLTRAEYLKTAADLLGVPRESMPQLPPEPFRLFPTGNLAENQNVGLYEATTYLQTAKELAERATSDSKALAALAPCAATPNPDAACARTTIEAFASKAFRRAASAPEVDELLTLHASVVASGGDFVAATRAVVAAILQAPDFLYRVEWGTGEGPRPDVQRLTGDEMATRLSYLFWGTAPDEALRAAAHSGALLERSAVREQAARLLADPRSRAGLASFFEDFLELWKLPQLHRTDPAYSPALGVALQEATQRFLASQIFERDASWPAVLTSNQAFVNGLVSNVYGVLGVTGNEWQEVSLDPTQRLGLLTQPGVLMAAVRSDLTNPTQRGYPIMERILCREVPPEPPEVTVPLMDPPSTPVTTRQRWTQETAAASCAPCHRDMDQLGYALENFDAMGRYRTRDNGLVIDTQVDVTGLGPTQGPIELVKKLSALPEAQACFAQRFAEFGLGKSLTVDPAGACLKTDLARRFEAAGYDVRQLLLDLTQTNAFLYLPKEP